MLHVITGPPCSGKSTYVREHAQDGDVLVDFDAIAQALGSSVAHGSEGHVREAAFKARNAVVGYLLDNAKDAEGWIIHSSPADWQLEAYETAGAEFIALDADMETCLERAEQDGRPPDEADKIREWFANNNQAPKGAFFMHSKGVVMNIKTKTVDVKADETNGSITGYASTWTREPDSYGDVVAKGAFAESIERIKAEGKAIPLLWNHDSYDLKSYIGTVTELARTTTVCCSRRRSTAQMRRSGPASSRATGGCASSRSHTRFSTRAPSPSKTAPRPTSCASSTSTRCRSSCIPRTPTPAWSR